jgi:hypothetical protein
MRSGIAAAFVSLALLAPAAGLATHVPTRTKKQAEVDVLRAVPRLWKPRRLHGLVDYQTHLLRDGTEAICRGSGHPYAGDRYSRFVCIVRPSAHVARQSLYVAYRARPHGRFTIRWLSYRRR